MGLKLNIENIIEINKKNKNKPFEIYHILV